MPSPREVPSLEPLGPDLAEDLLALDQWAFAYDRSEVTDSRLLLDSMEWDRTFGAWFEDPRRLAGIYSTLSARCSLPGGTEAAAAGLTWVGVHPRDRRRGVLRAMMGHHLAQVAAHPDELFSVLFAAEPAIYGRFGYGSATRAVTLTLPRGAALRPVPGAEDLVIDVEHADRDRHAEPFAACLRRASRRAPGGVDLHGAGRDRLPFFDPAPARKGAESLRALTVSTPSGELRGYALFRRTMRWRDHNPDGTVEVREFVALDPAAVAAGWSRLLDLDLTTQVTTPPLAIDDPLLHLLVNTRAAVPRMHDHLWLRLVDLPAALAARRYGTDLEVVLDVADALLPQNAGRWQLTAGPDGAECTATDKPPQLSLDVRDLGSAYLGGTSLTALAAAGLIRVHDAGAADRAAAAFNSPAAPHCARDF